MEVKIGPTLWKWTPIVIGARVKHVKPQHVVEVEQILRVDENNKMGKKNDNLFF